MIVSIAALQLGLSARLARHDRSALGLAVPSAAVLLVEALQLVTGSRMFFAAHVPAGVLIFGVLAWQVGTASRWLRTDDALRSSSAPFGEPPAESLDRASRLVVVRVRPWARLAPPLVLLQLGLGVLYRLRMSGVLLHLAGAFAASLLVLSVATIVLQQASMPAPLRRAARAAVAAVLAQVALGIVLLFLAPLGMASSAAWLAANFGHSVVGALTLAVSVAMAVRIDHYARQRSPDESR